MSNRQADYFIPLGNVHTVKELDAGVELGVDHEKVRISLLDPCIACVKVSKAGRFDEAPTFAVDPAFEADPVDDFRIEVGKQQIILRAGKLVLRVDRRPFGLSASWDGQLLFSSVPEWGYRYFNDTWLIRRHAQPGDSFYGLGEKTGSLNHRGKTLEMWNTDILAPDTEGRPRSATSDNPAENPTSTEFDPYYMSIPMLYHRQAGQSIVSGSFFDNGYRMHIDLSAERHFEVLAQGGQLTEYIFGATEPLEILRLYARLTGRMPAPPIWALGHHQCRWYDYSEQEWLELAKTYRDKNIPCDTLWLDIGYMDGYRVFTWDRERHPHVQESLETLKEQGFRAITIVDPGVKYEPGYAVFDEGQRKNLFCKTAEGQTYLGQVWPGRTAFPDFVKKEAREWWGGLNADHVRSGLAGIWNDMNEPATGVISPLAMRFDHGGEDHPHERYHNQYAMLMAMGTREGLKAAMPEQRTFILSRAGFAGIQRYAANWTGDNCARWEHLAMSVRMNLNLGMSGQPFIGSDIGGFCEDTQEELLVRWYQYGAFQPFMRNHACKGTIDQYPWSFSTKAERAIRQAVQLRYRLLPYLYTAFMLASETGDPIQRPLYLLEPDSEDAWSCEDAYMFGEHLLVAPILAKGQTKRTVYLPHGRWYRLEQDEPIEGGGQIDVKAPLHTIPVFVQAGAVIPNWIEAPATTMGQAPEEIALHVYVPAGKVSMTSWLHEDDGLTDHYREGAMVRSRFSVVSTGDSLTLSCKISGQSYPEHRRQRLRIVWHGIDRADDVLENSGQDFELTISL